MVTSDPIADMLTRIKNAAMAGKDGTIIPFSNIKMEIANVLVKKKMIKSATKKGRKIKKNIDVELLKDSSGEAKIKGIKRLSKPSRRIYYGVSDIKPVRNGYGFLVLSTPNGILSGEEAKKNKVGGEALFTIW